MTYPRPPLPGWVGLLNFAFFNIDPFSYWGFSVSYVYWIYFFHTRSQRFYVGSGGKSSEWGYRNAVFPLKPAGKRMPLDIQCNRYKPKPAAKKLFYAQLQQMKLRLHPTFFSEYPMRVSSPYSSRISPSRRFLRSSNLQRW